MKHNIIGRSRHRRKPVRTEAAFFKKENQEQTFFGESLSHDFFFHPSTANTQSFIHRKCEKCEEEEKQMQRMTDKKEEEKLQRAEDKKEKEEKLNRQPEKKEEEEKLQKKESSEKITASSNFTSSYVNTLDGKGQPLPKHQQEFFSSRMGYDFSNVKIHTDKEAAQSAKAVNAKAYTIGNNIVFNEGRLNFESDEGKKLLAHELTHTMQQSSGQIKRLQMNSLNESSTSGLTGDDFVAENEAMQNEQAINEPVPIADVTTFGRSSSDTVFANTVRFTGKTDANFDGGVGQTKNLKAAKAKDCKGCSGNECVTITGTFEITYSVTTNVTLPSVPEGLTRCQQERVKDAIDNKIAPHEQQHVSAFNTYNGKVQFPINYTGCEGDFQQHLQDINDKDGIARKAAAKAKSDSLDPFFVDVDLDCKEPAPPKK